MNCGGGVWEEGGGRGERASVDVVVICLKSERPMTSLLRDQRANLLPMGTGELVSVLYKLATVMDQLFDGEFVASYMNSR